MPHVRTAASIAAQVCLIAAIASVSCGRKARVPPEPSEASLRPYDFRGHTRMKLRRLCDGAALTKGSSSARRNLRCGLGLLDWFLLAVLREDAGLQLDLARFLKGDGPVPLGPPRGQDLLLAIGARFRAAAESSPGSTTARTAEAGLALVELQRKESLVWGYEYLRGIEEAARTGSPLEPQARIIIAGAALDGFRTLAKAAPSHRAALLTQGLGFPCPAEAEAARALPDQPTRPPSCPLSCPELASLLSRLPPRERKGLVAAKCPLSNLGLAHREHGIYLSVENLLATRSVSFQLQNLSALERLGSHPLVAAASGAFRELRRRLDELRVPLGLPELSPNEPAGLEVPLCASAEAPVTAPVVLVLDETRIYAGTLPVLAVKGYAVTFLDWREGIGFPGRPLEETSLVSLGEQIASVREISRRLLGKAPPQNRDRVAIYASSELSSGRLEDLLDLLTQLGVSQVELVLRNSEGALRAVPAILAHKRRGEGPPLSKSPVYQPDRAPLLLELGPVTLSLRGAVGPLAASPLTIPAGDLAGLREALEKTRRSYRDAVGVEVKLHPSVPYRDLARLLHHLRRSSSGRVLYDAMVL
ncbi:MAG: hypothetical protein RBU30_02190 [Polyangia bacterium]|nr:hypothetical protein [Polyangia bacterium]